MKVLKKHSQHRRDCRCDLECEACKHVEDNVYAYDDRNFWDNVIPNKKCEECGESTKSLGVAVESVATRYAAHEVV